MIKAAMPYRRYWLPELVVLLIIALVVTLVFWNSNLDIQVSQHFYHPENPQQEWPVQYHAPWYQLYLYGGLISIIITFLAYLVIAVPAFIKSFHRYQIYGVFLLLVMLLGPGVLVNGIFKDNWGRPRPRDVVQLGGEYQYVPPGKIADTGQKSFPCGHCSVGFTLTALYLVFRRINMYLALVGLVIGLVSGGALGYARVSAGGHFLSDVIWSFLITFSSAWLLYYFLLNIPFREKQRQLDVKHATEWMATRPILKKTLLTIVGLVILLGGLVSTPLDREYTETVPVTATDDYVILTSVDMSDIVLERSSDNLIHIYTRIKGFGFPFNQVDYQFISKDHTLALNLKRIGTYTEYRSKLRLQLPESGIDRLSIVLKKGDVYIKKDFPLPTNEIDIKLNSGNVSK